MQDIIKKVHVNAPLDLLVDKYMEKFLDEGLNPEIGLDAKALDRFSRDDFSRVAKRLRERGLSTTIHGPFMDLSPGSPDPLVWNLTKKRYEQALEAVSIFKPRTFVCHAGYEVKRYGYVREAWMEKSLEMWTWLSGLLADEGAKLMLENVYEHGPEEIEFVFENVPGDNVGFCFDIGHQSAFSKTNFERWMQVLGPYVGQLHLHDNDGSWDQHKSLGGASIDFASFFDILKIYRKTPPVITLEPHQEEDLVPSLRYLERIWPWSQ